MPSEKNVACKGGLLPFKSWCKKVKKINTCTWCLYHERWSLLL